MTTATAQPTEKHRKIWSQCYSVGVGTKAGNKAKRLDVARELATVHGQAPLKNTLAYAEEVYETPNPDRAPGLDGSRAKHDWRQGLLVLRAAYAMAQAFSS